MLLVLGVYSELDEEKLSIPELVSVATMTKTKLSEPDFQDHHCCPVSIVSTLNEPIDIETCTCVTDAFPRFCASR